MPRTAESIASIDAIRRQIQLPLTGDNQADSDARITIEELRAQAIQDVSEIIEVSVLGEEVKTAGVVCAKDSPLYFVAYSPVEVKRLQYWSESSDWRGAPDQEILPSGFGVVNWGRNGSQVHRIFPPATDWPARNTEYVASQFVVEVERGIRDDDVVTVQRAVMLLVSDAFQGYVKENAAVERVLSGLKPVFIESEIEGYSLG